MQTAVLREERSGLLRRLGFVGVGGWVRSLAIHVGLIAAFGVAIPLVKGLDFFDPLLLAAYACLGAIFAAPAVAQPFEPPSAARVDARIAWVVLYGEVIALAMIATGIATVYWTHRNRLFFLPDLQSLAVAVGFGFVLTYTLCAVAASLTLRFSPGFARSALRVIFLGLLALFWLRGRSILDQFGPAAAIALIFGLGFRFAIRGALTRANEGSR